jgi:hypothetical protein
VPAAPAGWAPPTWLALLAAAVLVALAARQVRRTSPDTTPEGWLVTVEVVLLSATPDGALAYRVLASGLPASADPDATALALGGLTPDPAPGALSHATSWRTTPDRGLVLTYTALPDPDPTGASPLTEPSIVCSDDPLRPAPAGLHAHHVAAHGARHFAYLARTDPTVRRSAAVLPEMWALLAGTADAPVAPHDRAHALAECEQSSAPAPC